MYNVAYLKIMYIQNDSQGLKHVLGAWEKNIQWMHFLELWKPTSHTQLFLKILYDQT